MKHSQTGLQGHAVTVLGGFLCNELLIPLGLKDGSFSDFSRCFHFFVLFSPAQIYNLCGYLFTDSLEEKKTGKYINLKHETVLGSPPRFVC